MNKDAQFMLRALELATLGRGAVSPNPLVGCVIVSNDRIIGEGYHEKYGGAHAEPNAVRMVADPTLLEEASLYVNLEPCAHFGKTAPCAHLLVEKKLKRVVIAVRDPNPLVGGNGIKILEQAETEVVLGVLEKKAFQLNRRFFTQILKKRPYVILKWAQTEDGFVARADYSSKWISNAHSRKLVHRWRAEEDAVLVGTKTAHFDDPKLNVRAWKGRDPVRVIIDRQLTLDKNLSLFDQSQRTICYNLIKSGETQNISWVRLQKDFDIGDILEDLYNRQIQSLIVEGGSILLQLFISEGLWDEARVFRGKTKFGNGIPAPKINRPPDETMDVLGDMLLLYKNN